MSHTDPRPAGPGTLPAAAGGAQLTQAVPGPDTTGEHGTMHSDQRLVTTRRDQESGARR